MVNIGSIQISITETPGHVSYQISGTVDESFKQENVPRIKAQTITLDLEGLKSFNSCGVREWVFLIKDLDKLGQLHFTKCSIPMVDQLVEPTILRLCCNIGPKWKYTQSWWRGDLDICAAEACSFLPSLISKSHPIFRVIHFITKAIRRQKHFKSNHLWVANVFAVCKS